MRVLAVRNRAGPSENAIPCYAMPCYAMPGCTHRKTSSTQASPYQRPSTLPSKRKEKINHSIHFWQTRKSGKMMYPHRHPNISCIHIWCTSIHLRPHIRLLLHGSVCGIVYLCVYLYVCAMALARVLKGIWKLEDIQKLHIILMIYTFMHMRIDGKGRLFFSEKFHWNRLYLANTSSNSSCCRARQVCDTSLGGADAFLFHNFWIRSLMSENVVYGMAEQDPPLLSLSTSTSRENKIVYRWVGISVLYSKRKA